jgi:hypothetical protein
MRRTLAIVLLLAFSAPTLGQDTVTPGTPRGWQFGGDTEKYDVGTAVLPRMKPGTQTAYIKAGSGAECGAYGALFQTIAADNYRGKRLKFSARLFEEHMAGGDFNLFIFVRGPGGDGAVRRARWDMGEVRNSGVDGNFRNESVIADVPADAQEITFGFRLTGPGGTGWVDAVRLEAIGDVSPVRALRPLRVNPNRPENMQFLGGWCSRRYSWLTARGLLLDRDERSLTTLARRSAPRGVQVALSAE